MLNKLPKSLNVEAAGLKLLDSSSDPIPCFKESTECNLYRFYIINGIEDAESFAILAETLFNATELDTVQIIISSPGGNLEAMNLVVEAIRMTEAKVQAIIVGDCSSAASIIALNCHEVHVLDSATMLVHRS